MIGKWAKSDLSNLENDLSNNTIKSISWTLNNIIPKKLYVKDKEKVMWSFFVKIGKSNQIWKATRKFYLFLQNGPRGPFWMTEYHFRLHFPPFPINTQLLIFYFFYKMAAGGHFGWPKITFDRISRHFRSIRSFFFLQNFWIPIFAKIDRDLPL